MSELNHLNIHLANIDSKFSSDLCEKLKLSTSSELKLLKRSSTLASRQFLVSRGLAAFILSAEWGSSSVEYLLDDSMSPPLISPRNNLHLSISHSKQYIAVVVSTNHTAVDIESTTRDRDYLGIAKKAFHPSEYEILEKSESHKKLEDGFYKTWTLRECLYKLGELSSLIDQGFDAERQIRDGGFTPFSYAKGDIYLSLISSKAININLIRHD